MSVLDFLRAAVAPTALATASYGQGQQEELDKQRLENRQTLLDQITQDRAKAEIAANTARADYYEHGGIYGLRPPAAPVPHTINTDQGIMQWDPEEQQYMPTGMNAPPKQSGGGSGAGATAQDRLNAKTALDEATRASPKPSTVPTQTLGTDAKGRATMIPNPAHQRAVSDSLAYDQSTIQPLRQHLLQVTIGNSVPIGGAGSTAASSTGAPSATPGAASGSINLSPATPIGPSAPARPAAAPDGDPAMRGEYDHAAQQLQSVLSSDVPDDLKRQAQASYDMRLAGIAKKYGQFTPQQ